MIDTSEEFDEIEILRKKSQELALVREMVSHPGWAVIQEHFKNVIHAVGEQLDIEESFEKIKRLQERKRAYKAMLEAVYSLCEEHSEVLLRLESVEHDQHERDQFGQ